MKTQRCRRCFRRLDPADAFSFYLGGNRRFIAVHQACARDWSGGGFGIFFAAKQAAAKVVALGGRMYKRGAMIAVEWAPHNRPPWPMQRSPFAEPEEPETPKPKRRRDRRRPSKPGRSR